MTTLREAAQQALEALEAMQSYAAAERKGLLICDESITVLRAALAQQAEPVEPVYWEVRCAAHPKWMRVDEQQFDEYVSYGWEGQRLYTAPPRRKLVSLTEDEIYHATGHFGVSEHTAIKIARAVEKASWEKNHGQA